MDRPGDEHDQHDSHGPGPDAAGTPGAARLAALLRTGPFPGPTAIEWERLVARARRPAFPWLAAAAVVAAALLPVSLFLYLEPRRTGPQWDVVASSLDSDL